MKILKHYIQGNNQVTMDTELRYVIASARVDSVELIRFDINESAEDVDRLYGCVIKVLRSIRKDRCFQFFLPVINMSDRETETQFLLNKYYDFVTESDRGEHSVFIKT